MYHIGVSEQRTLSLRKAIQLRPLDLEGEGTTFLRNMGKSSPKYTTSHSRYFSLWQRCCNNLKCCKPIDCFADGQTWKSIPKKLLSKIFHGWLHVLKVLSLYITVNCKSLLLEGATQQACTLFSVISRSLKYSGFGGSKLNKRDLITHNRPTPNFVESNTILITKRYGPHQEMGFAVHCSADPSGWAVKGLGLRPIACWECGFQSADPSGRAG